MLALARAKKQAGRDMDLINCWIISRHQYGAEYRNLNLTKCWDRSPVSRGHDNVHDDIMIKVHSLGYEH